MMDTRKQRKLISVPNENEKVVGSVMMGKLNNLNKTTSEMPRSILGDIAGNRLVNNKVDKCGRLPSITNGTLKSRLPILKSGGYTSGNSTILPKHNVTTKTKTVSLKENIIPLQVTQVKNLNLKSLVDKTKTLKLNTKKCVDRPVDVEDIDKNDAHNHFTVSIYANDIHSYLKSLEKTHCIKEDYLKNREITPKMRNVVIDWLVEVQQEYRLLQETLHITVGIFDKYLQNKHSINRNHMQLIGSTALFLATKYEEMTIPSAEDLVYIAASAFTEKDIYQMEIEIFRTIDFDFSKPISLHFLRRYSKAGKATGEQHTFAKYFLELALVHYSLCHFNSSLMAAAALYLAFLVTSDKEQADDTLWTKTLEYYSGYTFDDFQEVLKKLSAVVYNAKTSKFKAVVEKYANKKFMKVSVQPQLYDNRVKQLASTSPVTIPV